MKVESTVGQRPEVLLALAAGYIAGSIDILSFAQEELPPSEHLDKLSALLMQAMEPLSLALRELKFELTDEEQNAVAFAFAGMMVSVN